MLTIRFGVLIILTPPKSESHLQEALYVCAEILTTVGYGDVSPSSYASQAFCAVYSILGCSLIAAARHGPASWCVSWCKLEVDVGPPNVMFVAF